MVKQNVFNIHDFIKYILRTTGIKYSGFSQLGKLYQSFYRFQFIKHMKIHLTQGFLQ